jgi:hypothetical protein
MSDVLEINAATGEVIERNFTAAEKKQREKDAAEFAASQAAEQAAEVERVAALDSARVKLAALGLNDVEVAAVIGGMA